MRLRRRARDEGCGGAHVGRIDFDRCGAEEHEAPAAFDHGDVAGARAQRLEADPAQIAHLRRGDILLEAFGFDRDRHVIGNQRDAARRGIVLGFDRIVVGARDQPLPERFAPVLAAAGVTRNLNPDRGRREPDRADLSCHGRRRRENRKPARRRFPAANAHGDAPGARARDLEVDRRVAIFRGGRNEIATRGRHGSAGRAGERDVPPIGVLDEDGRVQLRRQVRCKGFGTASGARNASESLGKIDEFVIRHDGGLDHAKPPCSWLF